MPTRARIDFDLAFLDGLSCEPGEACKRRVGPINLMGLRPASLSALLRGQSNKAGFKPVAATPI